MNIVFEYINKEFEVVFRDAMTSSYQIKENNKTFMYVFPAKKERELPEEIIDKSKRFIRKHYPHEKTDDTQTQDKTSHKW